MEEQQQPQQPMQTPPSGQDQPQKSGMGTWLVVLVVIIVVGVVVWLVFK